VLASHKKDRQQHKEDIGRGGGEKSPGASMVTALESLSALEDAFGEPGVEMAGGKPLAGGEDKGGPHCRKKCVNFEGE